MNNCVFIGRLTRDVEVKKAGDLSVANFSVAVNRKFKKDGQPDADFLRMVAFGKNAENIEKFFKKGSEISLVTSVQTGSYEKDGKTVYTTDFLVNEWGFTGGSKSEGGSAPIQSNGSAPKVEEFVQVDEDFSDIPF